MAFWNHMFLKEKFNWFIQILLKFFQWIVSQHWFSLTWLQTGNWNVLRKYEIIFTFFDTMMGHENLPHGGRGRGPTQSAPRLLMIWRHKEPGHQQPWYWPPSSRTFRIQYQKGQNMKIYLKADFRFAPSQWETPLLCNNVSHWLGTNLESDLYLLIVPIKTYINIWQTFGK